MRNTNTIQRVPPAQAEAIYDLSLTDETRVISEGNNLVRVNWPHAASDVQVPRKALFESPVQRTNISQTSR